MSLLRIVALSAALSIASAVEAREPEPAAWPPKTIWDARRSLSRGPLVPWWEKGLRQVRILE